MARFHEVVSFEDFTNVIASLQNVKAPIFAEFYGAHDSSGKSWCPDCVKGKQRLYVLFWPLMLFFAVIFDSFSSWAGCGGSNENQRSGEFPFPPCFCWRAIWVSSLDHVKVRHQFNFPTCHALCIFTHLSCRWRDPSCAFRTDSRLKLACIPTLIQWGTSRKLLEEDCAIKTKVLEFVLGHA